MKTLLSLFSSLFALRSSRGCIAANDAPPAEIFAVNEAAYGVDDTGVMVVPFCEREVMVSVNGRRVRGLQRIDAQAGNEMAADMTSGLLGLVTKFIGRPIFLGHPYHPDATEAAKYPDKRARGSIKSVEVANDSIRLLPKYNRLGTEEVTDEQMIFHSPQWRMKPVMAANGAQEIKDGMPVFRPFSLHSGGLTNNPNIPVPPLMGANEGEVSGISMDLNKLVSALKDAGVIKDGDDESAILAAIGNIARDLQWARDAKAREERELLLLREKVSAEGANEMPREALLESLFSAVEAIAANVAATDTLKRELQTQIEAANERFTAARTAHVDAALLPLITANKIPGAQIETVRAELISAANEADIATRILELAKTKPKLGTTGGVTDELKPGANKIVLAANEQSNRARLRNEAKTEALHEITKGGPAKPGDDIAAWNLARSRNPALFAH